MKIVQFEDGTFGIRSYWFFGWYYVDLKDPWLWKWSRNSSSFLCCKGSLADARRAMTLLSDKHKVWEGDV